MSTNKKELLYNASHWLEQAKRNNLTKMGIGAIFVFFDQTEAGSAVCTSNVSKDRLRQELRTILKKMDDDRVIVNPFEN